MISLIDMRRPGGHPQAIGGSGREIFQTLGRLAQGSVVNGDATKPLKPPKGVYLSLAAIVVAGMVAAVELGQLAARHVMRVEPPGGIAEADARAKAAHGTQRWWADTSDARIPNLLPPVRVPDEAERAFPDQRLPAIMDRQPHAVPDRHVPLPLGRNERTVLVGKGDTLLDVLLRGGASVFEAHDAIDAMRAVFNPRSLKPGLALTVTFGPGAEGRDHLLKVSLPTSIERTVTAERGDTDAFSASKLDRPLAREVVRADGVIHSSLYEDGVAAGLPAPLLAELIRAFSYDVDFQREIQEGDRFEVTFERLSDGRGQVAKAGDIIYAALTLSGHTLKIYRYTPRNGVADYFNERGESVRKALLRTPVDGARITSGFGMRINPILGYSKMHRGVDFGAPPGTPIMAAGDGIVDMAGWNAGYGNYVRVRHNEQYGTAYAHMSRIASGLRKGTHVRQGQVIGYVGMTGLATGPHLHYEVLVHNQQINPLSVKLPTGIKLAGAELKAFAEAHAKTDAMAATLPPAGRLARTAF